MYWITQFPATSLGKSSFVFDVIFDSQTCRLYTCIFDGLFDWLNTEVRSTVSFRTFPIRLYAGPRFTRFSPPELTFSSFRNFRRGYLLAFGSLICSRRSSTWHLDNFSPLHFNSVESHVGVRTGGTLSRDTTFSASIIAGAVK